MKNNLFENAPALAGDDEFIETLLTRPGVRIERIVSRGQSSAPGFWFDQPQVEWVVLLTGEAVLRFEDEPEPRLLAPGDWVTIAARRRHRVESTAPDRPTIWLAVHLTDG